MSSGPLQLMPAATGKRPLAVRIRDLIFKKADTPDELAQVHELNFDTFVTEVGQYPSQGGPLLVDKFHQKNLYLIAKRGARVVGMLAAHDHAPFSVESRLKDSAWIARHCSWPLEVRLLAVRQAERNTLVLPGLLWSLYQMARAAGYSHLLASGIRQQLRLYRRVGFVPLGPEQLSGQAFFTPLVLELAALPKEAQRIAGRLERLAGLEPLKVPAAAMSLMPGPPHFAPEVRRALREKALSHRDPRFITRFDRARNVLGEMAGGVDVALFAGSGTSANECIAAALWGLGERRPGLVLINGEFGERLAHTAAGWGLAFRTLRWRWGQPWHIEAIQRATASLPEGGWVWGVHCETSTGVLNPIQALMAEGRNRGLHICIDCVSSLGSVEMELRGAFLASSASGKCLGAVAGLGIVLGDACRLRSSMMRAVPVSLDVCKAFESIGPRFTVSSTVLNPLAAELGRYRTPLERQRVYANYQQLGTVVRSGVLRLGARPLANKLAASPAVTTFNPPMGYSCEHFALLCRAYGFEINARSAYLRERGLVQIATMGDVRVPDCERLFEALEKWRRSAG